MGDAIVVEELEKSYGSVRALCGVNFTARTGSVLGLLGPNGAGKTTAVRILATLLKPDGGSARVAGLDVVKDAAALRAQIGLAGQYAAVDENLTGFENLEMVGQLYHMRRADARVRADELLDRFELTDAAKRPVKTYSGGMRRRLDLAAALVFRPPVLFLDEPTTGLDPRSRSASATTSSPATRADPPSGRSSVVRMRTAVVFPAPFGPRSPRTVPLGTSRSRPARAVTFPYRFTNPDVRIILCSLQGADNVRHPATTPSA